MKKFTILFTALIVSTICFSQTIIKMKRENGVSIVPCKVNGLDLSFIFDTGASEVTISLTEALFMLKNGYLNKTDIIGTANYSDANGDIHEGYTIILRQIEFAGFKLLNVKASIVKTLDAPLLLGQSAISKLGTIQIDFNSNTLTILKGKSNYDYSYNTKSSIDDGNVYHSVIIGTQVWMLENLKTTKFRNGDPIPNVIDAKKWSKLTTGAYCNYNNDSNNVETYGHLYNWYAVTDKRNIAPLGWHVATDSEWTILINYLGGENVAGSKLKETGTIHWNKDDYTTTTNETGFTAFPGGFRQDDGKYILWGNNGAWWSSTPSDNLGLSAWARGLFYNYGGVQKFYALRKDGFYVRCVKD